MSFPRKPDGSLDLKAFDSLSPEAQKEAILAIRTESPSEAEKVKQHILKQRQEARAAAAALEVENNTLLHMRQQAVNGFAQNTSEALKHTQVHKKKHCAIM